ncbi:MAG: calcium/sodium antiporter [Burkholderiales bacterium]|nr:calcium/sodium antiporter [Burkholderiales bacterium]
MLLPVAVVTLGFLVLAWAADRFVFGAAASARNLGLSPLMVGLTVVAVATSMPEVLISGIASWQGNAGLGMGNAVGSNIANIGLILGSTALFSPLLVRSSTLQRELPILLAITLIGIVLLVDGSLGRIDATVLLVLFGVVLYWLAHLGSRTRVGDPMSGEFDTRIPSNVPMRRAVGWLITGIIMLLLASRALVWGAVNIAQALGVSDLVIGLTIVAIGTSLPELATSIASAFRYQPDIAIGTVIGSNIFNLLAVLGVVGMIQPSLLPAELLTRDYPTMIALTLALFAMAYGFGGSGRINRLEGAVLLACFVVYQLYIYFNAR